MSEKNNFIGSYGSKHHIDQLIDSIENNEEKRNSIYSDLPSYISENPTLSSKDQLDRINRLAKYPRFQNRMAYFHATHPDTLDILAKSPSDVVRADVAMHKNTRPETRKMLLGDESPLVREAVGKKISDDDDIDKLIDSGDHNILTGLSTNINLKPKHLLKIASHPEYSKALSGMNSIPTTAFDDDVHEAIVKKSHPGTRMMYIISKHATQEALHHFAKHGDVNERQLAIAQINANNRYKQG